MQSPDQLPVLMPTATDRDSSAAAEKMSDAADAKSTTLPDETVPEEKMSDGAADENTATPEETTGNTPKAPEVAAAAIAADTAQTSQSKSDGQTVDDKQLARYFTVLRDFMSYHHNRKVLYPPSHTFTRDELLEVTPDAICKWKAISYFMPQKDGGRYDPDSHTGNPTRSTQVKDLIKRIRSIMDNNSSAKLSRKHAPKASDMIGNKKTKLNPLIANKKTKLNPPVASKPAGQPATKLNPPVARKPAGQPAPRQAAAMATATILQGSSISSTAAQPPLSRDVQILAMQGILHRVHAQNLCFMELFGTLSTSLEQFRQTLAATNIGIMAEVQRLSLLNAPPPVVPSVTQTKRPATKVASTVAQATRVQPVSAVVNGSGAQMKHSSAAVVENNRPTSQDSQVQPVLYEYLYLHPDGVRRRAGESSSVSMFHSLRLLSPQLADVLALALGGHSQPHHYLQPMIKFAPSDMSFLPKRARQSYNEVKGLVRLVDDKAKSLGVNVKAVMTPAESASAFQKGSSSLVISSTTPSGRQRNVAKLKWATLLKYANKSEKEDSVKKSQEASSVTTLNAEATCDNSDDPEKQDECKE
ncbi:hypothetical protein THAOC_35004 [Thalassiosira oceanica]|uniref:Uncharacterized protein n=1 Tax=Thalassiosira oceanica TaxID=159749 RepID=K0RB78_THAOC|nr:hypothetical protein THAOC_35004 [Thalassiosira oceanica]|eukprot:EJK46331.1 hypothetical protein THAOC_35004 [Thalassiosira oceanica]